MFIKILIGLCALLVVLVMVIATRPAEFSIQRSVVVNASPDRIFPHLNDLRAWEKWSPWMKKDPSMKMTYQEQSRGPGATMSWVGNSQSGEGSMTILSETTNQSLALRLDFLKPFESSSESSFLLMPKGDTTTVTWKMTGKNNFIGKAISLIMDMDKAVGPDFETGLNGIKQLSESATP